VLENSPTTAPATALPARQRARWGCGLHRLRSQAAQIAACSRGRALAREPGAPCPCPQPRQTPPYPSPSSSLHRITES